jgi:hypothetical protein
MNYMKISILVAATFITTACTPTKHASSSYLTNPPPRFTLPSPSHCGDDCSVSVCCSNYGDRDGKLVDLMFGLSNEEATMLDVTKFAASFCYVSTARSGVPKLIPENSVNVLALDHLGGDWFSAKVNALGVIDHIYYSIDGYKLVCGNENWDAFKRNGLFNYTDLQ